MPCSFSRRLMRCCLPGDVAYLHIKKSSFSCLFLYMKPLLNGQGISPPLHTVVSTIQQRDTIRESGDMIVQISVGDQSAMIFFTHYCIWPLVSALSREQGPPCSTRGSFSPVPQLFWKLPCCVCSPQQPPNIQQQ